MIDDPSDLDTVRQMADEIAHKRGPFEISFTPQSALQIAGLIQLALRHPHVGGNNATTARAFLAGVGEYFADCPTVLDVLRRGDDPREDRTWERIDR
jgi:hypothetical protein